MSADRLSEDSGSAAVARVAAPGSRGDLLGPLVAQAPVALFLASAAGAHEWVNARWCELSGLEPEQALGEGWRAAVHPDDRARVVALLAPGSDAPGELVCEYRVRLPDDAPRFVELHAHARRDGAGAISGWIGACFEVTSRRLAYEAALLAGERFRVAFEHAPIATGITTPAGDWLEVNTALCALVGFPAEELVTLRLTDLVIRGEAAAEPEPERELGRGEYRYRRADGTTLWVAASTAVVRGEDAEPLYRVVQIVDIGDRKQAEAELRELADHDGLTGLLNRRGFMDGLRRELRRMDRRGEYGALLLLDLDNFKLVNDTAGHLVGDRVLRTTAEVLRRRLRATDLIGRLGGDEFAALVLNVTPRQAREIAAETAETLRQLTVTAGDQTVKVSASIGVVAIEEVSNDTEDDLLAAADREMYRAKGLGRER
jgi:diguanylate cyclase (GGDEF)-like protein/PAS domain S-box-containing protein